MTQLLDCQGLACPEPVLLTRQALQEARAGRVTVLVSSAVARDNVTRAARSMGWKVSMVEQNAAFKLTLEKESL